MFIQIIYEADNFHLVEQSLNHRFVLQFASLLSVVSWFYICVVLCVSGSGEEGDGERTSVILGEDCYWGPAYSLGVHPSMCLCVFICVFGYTLAMNQTHTE